MAEHQQPREANQARPNQSPELSSQEQTTTTDLSEDSILEQVETLAAGAGASDDIDEGGLGEKLAELAVTTEEEVDALRINLLQDEGTSG